MKKEIYVYIVEDQDDMYELTKSMIDNMSDISILERATNGKDAIKQIPKLKPDVVIMDIGLPDITGIDCVRTLKPSLPEAEFIMFTVFDTDEKIFEALKVGASSYLTKSSSPEELEQTIKGVHQGESPMNGDIARKMISILQRSNQPNKDLKVTNKEEQVLNLLAKGQTYIEIADNLNITVKTLKGHIYRLYQKLQVDNRTEAVNKYFGRY